MAKQINIDLEKIVAQCRKSNIDPVRPEELAIKASGELGTQITLQRVTEYLRGDRVPGLLVFAALVKALDPEAKIDDFLIFENGKTP